MTGSTDVLETLISYGADLDAVNDEHSTPLFFACQCSNQYAAHVLLVNGANIRAKNLQGIEASIVVNFPVGGEFSRNKYCINILCFLSEVS